MRRPLRIAAGAALALAGLFALSGADHAFAQLAMVATLALAGLGAVLIIGQAGQLTLGHGAMLALGAYAEAVLAAQGLSPLLSLPAAAAAGALGGALAGLPARRLDGVYLGLSTLALAMIVEELANLATPLTGGAAGRPVAALSLFGWRLTAPWAQALCSLLCLVLALLLLRRLLRSRQGRAWRALREDAEAARACGIDGAREKLRVFVLGGALGGWAGGLYAHWIGFVSPDQFGLMLSFELLMLVFIGGVARPLGALLGAAAMVAIPQLIALARDLVPGWSASAGIETLAFGAVIVAVVLLFPHGLAGRGR